MTMTKPTAIERLPFAFWLEDRLEQSAIYMVDADKRLGQRLNLYIENTEAQTLFFSPTNLDQTPISKENCHFELRFRREVLAGASLGTSTVKGLEGKSIELLLTGKYQKRAYDIGSWVISEPDDHGGEQPYVSFYLARAEKGSGGRFLPGERHRLVLTNISANPEADSSETRIELLPRELFYDPPLQNGARRVTEPREQNVLVVNHIGKEHIPLHLAFIGPYTVRNDGQAQGEGHLLRLRITNTSRHDTITFHEKSRLLFAFDFADGDQEEELGTAGNLEKIRIYLKEKYTQQADREWKEMGSDATKIKQYLERYCVSLTPPSPMEQNPLWKLGEDQALHTLKLEPHQHWDILLDTSDFVTHSPAGLTPLHLTYEHIPGYWDGKLHAAVEKTPLLVRKGSGIHGQGTETVEMDSGNRTLYLMGNDRDGSANNHARLHVMGRTFVDGKFVATGETELRGKALIGTDGSAEQLEVKGHSTLKGDLNVGGDGNAKVTVRHIEGKQANNRDSDNLYLNYYSGKDVHIGHSGKQASLHVSGRLKDKTGDVMPVGAVIAFGGRNIPNGWLECKGQTISKSQFPDLVEQLTGSTSATSAKVPDLRRRFIVGVGANSAHNGFGLNDTGGEERVTLDVTQMPSHGHEGETTSDGSHSHTGKTHSVDKGTSWSSSTIKGFVWYNKADGTGTIQSNGSGHTHSIKTHPTGGGQPHNNLPPYYALRYIIKY
jgi:microcystin-dependent protein